LGSLHTLADDVVGGEDIEAMERRAEDDAGAQIPGAARERAAHDDHEILDLLFARV